MSNFPSSDTGFVVYTPFSKTFWTGNGWTEQPRLAKIYRSQRYAKAIVDRFPNNCCRLMHIDITVSELP